MRDDIQSTVSTNLEAQTIQIQNLAQYVRDLSFECPNAPEAQQVLATGKPRIDVKVNVNAQRLQQDVVEVALKLTANAFYQRDDKTGERGAHEKTAFVVELDYVALFNVAKAPREALEQILLIEAPRQMFPFVRRIVADNIRDGGFPSLMLDPIDFAALYRKHKEQEAQTQSAPTGRPN